MKSTDIKGLSVWVDWSLGAVESAPSAPGVYILRMEGQKELRRVIGSSDIVYIGSSKKRTIKDRLKGHFRKNRALDRVCKNVGQLEVAWRSFATDENVELCECELIGRYEQDHVDLPPVNRTQPLAKWQELRKDERPEIQRMMELAPKCPML